MFSEDEMTYAAFESRYRDRYYIGSGGFAKVYKVFDHAKNHYVALKMADVRPEWKQFTLKREVELVNSLPFNRNIARYENCYRFNTGMTGQVDFAILKFYEYGNLEKFLAKNPALGLEDKRVIIRGILNGILFLHENNIIHRDLKAQNILMHREDGVWTPKITDFGLSRQTAGNSTVTNSAVGLSYAYAAPEQIENEKIYKNVDLWAVGVLIYRIIAGELPFQSNKGADSRSTKSQLQISRKIVNMELPEKLETLEEPFRAMIKRCFVRDPQDRVQSAEELIAILKGEAPVEEQKEPFPFWPEQEESGDETVVSVSPDQEDSGRPLMPDEEVDKTDVLIPGSPEEGGGMPPVHEEEQDKVVEEKPQKAQPQEEPPLPPIHDPMENFKMPNQNPTQYIPYPKKEEPAPEPPRQPRMADRDDRIFSWWLIVIPVLLVAIAAGVYWWASASQTGDEGAIPWDKREYKSAGQSGLPDMDAAEPDSTKTLILEDGGQ